MEAYFIYSVTLVVTVYIIMSSYNRLQVRRKEIEETAKNHRAVVYSESKNNIRKMDGLFDINLAKLTQSAGGSEEEQLLSTLLQAFAGRQQGDSMPQNVTWDVIKEQLKNPEIKRLIQENRKEALEILQS